MHLIRAHRLLYVRVPQVMMNMISLTVEGTFPSVLFCGLSIQEVWKERLPVKTEAKNY